MNHSDVGVKTYPATDIISQMSYDFLYGVLSAVVSKTTVAPLERLKLLLQTRFIDTNINATTIISNIVKEQGIVSLWRGNWPNIVRYFPVSAFMLSFKEQFKLIFVPQTSDASTFSIVTGSILAGGTAGCVAITIIYPLDLTRTRLAVDMGANNREFRGIVDCLNKTYRSGGIFSWYQGLYASYWCYFIYRGLQIGGYDAMKRIYNIDLKNKNKNNNFDSVILGKSFALSYGITASAMTIAYPFDTIRRKMMMQAGVDKDCREYKSMWECGRNILQQNGYKGLYRGLAPNYFRAFGSSIVLVLFDCFKSF